MSNTNTQAPTPMLNKVSAIDLILSPTGAVQGFPTVKGVDLNVPGWVNDTTTTFVCRLVFQFKFTLSGIRASEVAFYRSVARVATMRNPDGSQKQDTKTAPGGGQTGDGPDVSTVVRPNDSLIVVSDDPGAGRADAGPGPKSVFPITYQANFVLYAADYFSPNKTILAKVSYALNFQKQTFDDTSPTATTLTSIAKTIY